MNTPRLWWLMERVQAALPMVAVAGLAGFTWWLVQSAPKDGGQARAARVPGEPDYVLTRARVARFDATGRVVAVVDGDRMLHRPDLDVLDIDAVVLTARDAKGLGLRATALRGVADPNARQVTLQGEARVTAWPDLGASSAVLPAPIVFEGEDLLVDTALRSLQSTRPVTLTRADSRIQGSALRYEHLTGVTDLAGRVTGHYVPQALSAHTRLGKARSQP